MVVVKEKEGIMKEQAILVIFFPYLGFQSGNLFLE